MSDREIPKIYNPGVHEDNIYKLWEESGFFNPDNIRSQTPDSRSQTFWHNLLRILKPKTYNLKPNFTIVMPPPNVTGTLHVGHAVMLAVEDIMIRFARMRGKKTLWVPGTDHAAIATQTVVEKKLIKEGIKDPRQTLGREKFLKEVEKFAAASHDRITTQVKKMGASCDWSREAYTLDEARSLAVRTMFKMMYDDGLVYRGNRIVNWCPGCKSTLADDEVEYREEKAPFYYFKYGPVVIGTARPETKFLDKTIVVHPDDERYKNLHNQEFEVDWIDGKIKSNVIADPIVDPEFGTGAMTITPAHSFEDFELAEKYDLPTVQIIDEDGNFTEAAGTFAGKNALKSRKEIVEILKKKGLLDRIDEDYVHRLSICYRCETPVEPLPKLQWFIDVKKEVNGKSLKDRMREAVSSGKVKILPERFTKTYFHWIDNLRDWCISRQIWYGHRIPVWYRGDEIFVDINPPEDKDWKQDEDTLDTWFSSGLWTFSALGWPMNCQGVGDGVLKTQGIVPWAPIGYSVNKPKTHNLKPGTCRKTGDLAHFHPTSVLETGYDILFFWIARMIMMTTYALDEVPFRTVYLHGLIRDAQGRKMSKSLGNVIDPLDMTEKYGADATRLSLIIGTGPGNDMKLSEAKIAGYRNFTNKLWNIARYILTTGEVQPPAEVEPRTLADHWILQELERVTVEVTKRLEKYEFSPAGELLRDFTWGSLADWYIEISKIPDPRSQIPENTKHILMHCLQRILKLWHPFMPFVTEVIWQDLVGRGFTPRHSLMIEPWPEVSRREEREVKRRFEALQKIISAIRNIRAEYKIPPVKKVKVAIGAGKDTDWLKKEEAIIKHLARVEDLEFSEKLTTKGTQAPLEVQTSNGEASAVVGTIEISVSLEGTVDAEKERNRLQKAINEIGVYVEGLTKKLINKEFTARAPKQVIQEAEQRLAEAKEKLAKLKTQLKAIQ